MIATLPGLARTSGLLLLLSCSQGSQPACGPAEAGTASPGLAQAEQETPGRGAPSIRTLAGFAENRGQWPSEVLFHAREGSVEATLLRGALCFVPAVAPDAEEETVAPLVLRWPGRAEEVEGRIELPTRHHFLRASGSATDVRGFERVRYREVLAGIDVEVRTEAESFEYDLVLAPGADLSSFVVEVEGAERLELVEDDLLALHTPTGPVEQRIRASWQLGEDGEEREPISCRYRLLEPREGVLRFGFEAPGWDRERALVLDPSLVWATYVGGPSGEVLRSMDVDAQGGVYLLSRSWSGTPTVPGALQPEPVGGIDVWVGKLSPDGSTLEWGTYLGGSATEDASTVGVDADGSVVVSGRTWSSDFPTTPSGYQTENSGLSDIFVVRLDPSGSTLLGSTLFGGEGQEEATAMALLPSGDVAVAARVTSSDLPTTPGVFDPIQDEGDKMVLRFSADGSDLVFATYFHTSRILDMAVDAESHVYLCGDISAQDAPLPTTRGAFQETFGPGISRQAFVTKMEPFGAGLIWSTYLGGEENSDTIWGIAIDAASAVYVTGDTSSGDFPVTDGAFDPMLHGQNHGFVTKLLPGGTGLVWSTYLGSTCACGGSGYPAALAVDAAGNVHAAGWANEPGWPTTPDAFQPFYIGPFPHSDAALTKLDAFGEQLVYSTWLGGSGTDYFADVDLDASAHPCLAFESFSSDIPVTPGAYDTTYAGSDIVVAKFDLPLLPWEVLAGGLAGSTDTPNLAGAGELTPGSTTRLAVRGAAPNALGWGVAGFTEQWAPLLGGTLVPSSDLLVPVATDASGALDLTFPWPSLAPTTELVFQFWVQDPGAPAGWSATNALTAGGQ